MRSDLNSVSDELARVDALASQFRENNTDYWPHLKNKEDFSLVYQLPDELRMPLENLYGEGRNLSVSMTCQLMSYLDVSEHPTFTSYVEHIETQVKGWLPHSLGILKAAETALDKLTHKPWSVREMLKIQESQIRIMQSLQPWTAHAKETRLFKRENNMTNPDVSEQANRHINIHTFQGILGSVVDSTVTQNLDLRIEKDNFDAVRSKLKDVGLSDDDIDELQTAFDTDPVPVDAQRLGPAVSMWLGKLIAKSADGTYQLSIATAATVLGEVVLRYYGLK